MAVQVLMPREKEKKDPLDTIIKGLHIASSIYGIKEAADKSNFLKSQAARESQKAEAEAQGIISGEKQLQYGDKYTWSDKPSEGSLAFKKKGEDGSLSSVYAVPRPREADPLAQAIRAMQLKDLQSKMGTEGHYLPDDKKAIVSDLSKKNASKIGIANQIDAVMSGWDELSDDQKVAQGGQLLKTLNSPEGADAIGAEEAKRLGSKLQFAMGNLFNTNPIQFGRDLEGFKTQALDTSDSLKKSISANQAIIDETMGNKSRQTAIGEAAKRLNKKSSPKPSGSPLPSIMSDANASEGPQYTKEEQDAAMKELIKRKGLSTNLKSGK